MRHGMAWHPQAKEKYDCTEQLEKIHNNHCLEKRRRRRQCDPGLVLTPLDIGTSHVLPTCTMQTTHFTSTTCTMQTNTFHTKSFDRLYLFMFYRIACDVLCGLAWIAQQRRKPVWHRFAHVIWLMVINAKMSNFLESATI